MSIHDHIRKALDNVKVDRIGAYINISKYHIVDEKDPKRLEEYVKDGLARELAKHMVSNLNITEQQEMDPIGPGFMQYRTEVIVFRSYAELARFADDLFIYCLKDI
jgi:translation initiation factor 2 alpha subunit (eIF-2alpha)